MKDVISVIQPAPFIFFVCLIWKMFVVPDIKLGAKCLLTLTSYFYYNTESRKCDAIPELSLLFTSFTVTNYQSVLFVKLNV